MTRWTIVTLMVVLGCTGPPPNTRELTADGFRALGSTDGLYHYVRIGSKNRAARELPAEFWIRMPDGTALSSKADEWGELDRIYGGTWNSDYMTGWPEGAASLKIDNMHIIAVGNDLLQVSLLDGDVKDVGSLGQAISIDGSEFYALPVQEADMMTILGGRGAKRDFFKL